MGPGLVSCGDAEERSPGPQGTSDSPTQCPFFALRLFHPPLAPSPILESWDLGLLSSDCPDQA